MISRTGTRLRTDYTIGKVLPVAPELVRDVEQLVERAMGKHERRRELLHAVYDQCGDPQCDCTGTA